MFKGRNTQALGAFPKSMVQKMFRHLQPRRITGFRNLGKDVFPDLRNHVETHLDGANSRAHFVVILRGFSLRVTKVVI